MGCDHEANAQIAMPSKSGRAAPDVCPFVWCRKCGALWLPKQPAFDRAFERHEKEKITAPIDDINVEGYWVLPGLGAIIQVPH